VYMHTADDGLVVTVPVTAGSHDIGVSFVRRHWEPEGILQPPQRGFARTTNELYYGDPAVDIVSIAGPYSPRQADDTPSRRAVFVCRPSSEPGASKDPPPAASGAVARTSDEECARTILSRLVRRPHSCPPPHHAKQTPAR